MEYRMMKVAALSAACLALSAPTAHAKLKYEPDSYVRDGLVLQLDGIRNDGALKPHNLAAAEWRNLMNGANPLLFVRRDENDGSAWTDAGYRFAGKSHGITAANLPSMSMFSVEFFGDFPPSGQIADQTCYPTYVSAKLGSQNLSILTQSNWSTIYFSAISGTTASLAPQISQSKWNGKFFSYILDAEIAAAHVGTGGVYVAKSSARSATEQANSIPAAKWLVANAGFKANYYDVPGTDYTRQARGVCKAVRIYSRALSAEEVAANHALDVIRFETGIPVTNAVVATSVTGAEGTEPCGAYAVDGSHTFSAPGRATVGGTEWFCTGHTLEAWDSAAGTWGAPTMSVATRRVVAEGEKVRITWLWSPDGAARSAATYDVGDYAAASNLIVQLDGIRNAGLSEPHDDAVATWADLSAKGSHATFTLAAGDVASGWNGADGYFFGASSSYAKMAGSVTPGESVTLEMLGEFDTSVQEGWESAYVSGPSDFKILTAQQYSQLWWVVEAYAGTNTAGRPQFNPWKGRNFAATMDSTTMKLFENGVRKSSKTRPSVVAIPATRFAVAESAIGTVKAFRVYDRALTAEEIAWNHKVDAVRYGGALTVTNVVVAGEYGNYPGAAPGEYEVIGSSYTFTAGTAADDGARHTLAGYTVEEWDGTGWTGRQVFRGNAYTYAVGTSPAKVRLTWKWNSATVMMVK